MLQIDQVPDRYSLSHSQGKMVVGLEEEGMEKGGFIDQVSASM